MPRYEVIRPWNGVERGQIVELKAVHPALKSHVRAFSQGAKLEPATPAAGAGASEKERKFLIVARLKELNVDFDARKGVDDLAALLPPEELAALFPAA